MNNLFTAIPLKSQSPIHMYEQLSKHSNTIEITNKKIINFYNLHPNIDIDEVNLYFINMISKLSSTNDNAVAPPSILSNITLHERFDKICPTTLFTNILSKLYSNADIAYNYIDEKYNIACMKRINKPKILLKNTVTESNVSNEDIVIFNNLTDQENCCGIILSQNSGISNKNHYQIDIRSNNNVTVYLHNVNYSQSIITAAIDIIDNLYHKLQDVLRVNDEDHVVPNEILTNINNEYQMFMNHKSALTDIIKEYNKKMLSQLEECRFTSLESYLSQKFSMPIQKTGFNCELCNKYSAHNLKALAAHKRGCIRKKIPT